MNLEVPPEWRAILACPECKQALEGLGGCARCGLRFEHVGECPELFASGFKEKVGEVAHARWREALTGLEAWRERQLRSRPLRVIQRSFDSVEALIEELSPGETVVDVGGADGAKREYFIGRSKRYLVVDPMAVSVEGSALDRELLWWAVRGLGECLPVQSRSVDTVLSLSAFDYLVDVNGAVREWARVLRPMGRLGVFVTAHETSVARAREAPDRFRRAGLSLTRSVVTAVGLRGALALALDVARINHREHTRYLSENEILSAIEKCFSVLHCTRTKGRYSTTLRIVAERRGEPVEHH